MAKFMRSISCLVFLYLTTILVKVDGITKCAGADMTFTEDQVMHMQSCMDLVGIKKITDLGMEHAGCFSKCVMIKKGLIDDDGKPHKEKIREMLEGSVQDELKEPLKVELEKCLETEGPKVDVKEEGCMSFLPLAMCVHATFTSLC